VVAGNDKAAEGALHGGDRDAKGAGGPGEVEDALAYEGGRRDVVNAKGVCEVGGVDGDVAGAQRGAAR
jgi:hypothetical protein